MISYRLCSLVGYFGVNVLEILNQYPESVGIQVTPVDGP